MLASKYFQCLGVKLEASSCFLLLSLTQHQVLNSSSRAAQPRRSDYGSNIYTTSIMTFSLGPILSV